MKCELYHCAEGVKSLKYAGDKGLNSIKCCCRQCKHRMYLFFL
ncbi:hypothetical protein BN1183_AC_02090 [Pantoea ananatis]|nr:hypothetical protein BN1183_AC_02090 [Pantoea ananatis]